MEHKIYGLEIRKLGDSSAEPILRFDEATVITDFDKVVANQLKEIKDMIFLLRKNKYGAVCDVTNLIPAIKDVNVINGKVVVILFADGKEEKAVLDDKDIFSIEQGISICLMKKLISCHFGFGSSIYNKLVEMGMSFYDKKLANEEAEKQRQIAEAEANERKWVKAQKRKAKRDAKIKAAQEAETERQIEIQKEAYLRAMREFKNTSGTTTD